jgi:hypothetical protein
MNSPFDSGDLAGKLIISTYDSNQRLQQAGGSATVALSLTQDWSRARQIYHYIFMVLERLNPCYIYGFDTLFITIVSEGFARSEV